MYPDPESDATGRAAQPRPRFPVAQARVWHSGTHVAAACSSASPAAHGPRNGASTQNSRSGSSCGKLGGAAGAHPRADQLGQRAHDRLRHRGRHGRRGGRPLEPRREQRRELPHRAVAQGPCARAGGERLDERDARLARMPRERVERPGERAPDARGPACLLRGGGTDPGERALEQQAVSGEEAVFAVGELLVEGLAGDVRVRDHRADGHCSVAVGACDGDRGVQQPDPLGADDVLAREPMAPTRERRQQPVEILRAHGRGSLHADRQNRPPAGGLRSLQPLGGVAPTPSSMNV